MRIVELLFYNRPSFKHQQKLHNCRIVSVYEFIYSYTSSIMSDSHKLGQNMCALYVRFFKWKWMQLLVWSSVIITTYICIYTYKHRGLYKFAHFVCTIIIVIPRITIVHIVSDCYELSKDAVALCLTISLHMVKYFVTRYMYIYICAYVYTYIHTYVQELYFVL